MTACDHRSRTRTLVSTSVRLALVFGIVAACAAWPRMTIRAWRELPEQRGFAMSDPDSQYHLRRIQLWMEGQDVGDGVDPWLNYPHGARVPWPPYYTVVLRAMIGPGAPDDPAERLRWIERRAARVPLVFGLLTSLLAAAAAWILLRPAVDTGQNGRRHAPEPPPFDLRWMGALSAGLLHAFFNASVFYSPLGIADHHAFVSCLNAAMLLAFCWVLMSAKLEPASNGLPPTLRLVAPLRWGLFAGALAGVLLGAWVGSLMYVIGFQIALAVLLFLHARRPLPGLPVFGLSYHLAAAACVLPAAISSPWLDVDPWMVVNISWFHPAFLLLGAAVFVPLLRLPANPENALHRRYPWLVGAALALLGLLLAAIPNPMREGIRAGFSWLSTSEEFMTNVAESRPLIGPGAEPGVLVQYLGYGVYLLPIAWLVALVVWWRRGRLTGTAHDLASAALLPWLVAVPLLLMQALGQRRFGDALAMPMAVLLAVGLILCLRPLLASMQRRLTRGLRGRMLIRLTGLGVLLPAVAVMSWPAIQGASHATAGRQPGPRQVAKLAAPHEIYYWLRDRTGESEPGGVLTNWGQGHAVAWSAQHPSVACNFGSYVGVESFQAPSRFFLSESAGDAEQVLLERQVRWVIVPWQLPGMLRHQVAALGERPLSDYRDPGHGGLTAAWFHTVGAQLMFDGRPPGAAPAPGLSFLRLVHESPVRMGRSQLGGVDRLVPAGWIWEHVLGARVQATGRAGDRLEISLAVDYPGRGEPLIWRGGAVADSAGIATVRVPYCTDQKNGDGIPAPEAEWRFSDQSGTIVIPESAVRAGATVKVQR